MGITAQRVVKAQQKSSRQCLFLNILHAKENAYYVGTLTRHVKSIQIRIKFWNLPQGLMKLYEEKKNKVQ